MLFLESDTVELKEKLTDTMIKDIEAFLNTEGGTIYVGVKDDGTVVGVNFDEAKIREISDMISDKIEPSAIDCAKIGFKVVEGKAIIEIVVSPGKAGIYCIKKYGLSSNGCHIRVGTTCKSMTASMIKQRYERHFLGPDKMTVTPTLFSNISFDKLKYYLNDKGLHTEDSNFETNFKLRTLEGRYNFFAELLSDENTIPFIFAKFQGKDKSKLIERKDFGNRSILLVYEMMKMRLEVENTVTVDTTVRPRNEITLFDFDAVNEAVLNAFVHNDYLISQPQVSFFEDRIEIVSHGGLPNGLSVENFFNGVSRPRNDALMSLFSKLRIVDHTGHGISTIIRKYGKGVFDIQENVIIVTIPFNKKNIYEKTHHIDNNYLSFDGPTPNYFYLELGLNKNEYLIIHELRNNPFHTAKTISSTTNISLRTVERCIAHLKENGLLQRVGSNKNGHWNVIYKG